MCVCATAATAGESLNATCDRRYPFQTKPTTRLSLSHSHKHTHTLTHKHTFLSRPPTPLLLRLLLLTESLFHLQHPTLEEDYERWKGEVL